MRACNRLVGEAHLYSGVGGGGLKTSSGGGIKCQVTPVGAEEKGANDPPVAWSLCEDISDVDYRQMEPT